MVLDVMPERVTEVCVDVRSEPGDGLTLEELAFEHLGRGCDPAPEPVVLIDDQPAVDQAVFDAEFVAMVLAEAGWEQSHPTLDPTPPRSVSRTRRVSPPPRYGPEPADGHWPLSAVLPPRSPRRRVGPGPRSPPTRQGTHRCRRR